MANAFVRAFGIPPASETEETHSEQELRMIIGQSTRQGVLKEDEEGMLNAVIQLEETRAREIMVPRPNVVALPAEMGLRELVSVAAAGAYTRYPIFEDGSIDRVIGAVHVKDVLRAIEAHGGLEAEVTVKDLMREVLTAPRTGASTRFWRTSRSRRSRWPSSSMSGALSRGSSPSRTSWKRSSARSGTSSMRRSRRSGS